MKIENNNKIIMIQPLTYSKYPGMPMGIIYTASSLINDYKVTIYDLTATPMDDQSLKEILLEKIPSIVMIGGTSPSQPETYKIAALVKAVNPNIIVIKGGPHELYYPKQTALNPNIDYIISGDGESSSQLIKRIMEGNQNDKIFNGKINLKKIKTLPPRYLLYFRNPHYYNFLGGPTAQIRSTRGCMNKCNYCSQGEYREYSIDYIEEDINDLWKNSYRCLYWDDALFTQNKHRMNRIFKILRSYNFKMGCITRAGINTSRNIFSKMYDVGFRYIWFALESGDAKIRQKLGRRGVGSLTVKNAVRNAKAEGFKTYVNIIIGTKYEDNKSIEATINALKYINPNGVSASVYTIYPGMKGCKETTYENPINRHRYLMHVDEGYGGNIMTSPEQTLKWYSKISNSLKKDGIKMLDFDDCKTPTFWDLPNKI